MVKYEMKLSSVLRPLLLVGLVTLPLTIQSARAEPSMFVPLGNDDRIVVIDTASDRVVSEIAGVTAVHGLARTPDGRFLIAGSFKERGMDGAAPAKPESVTEDEHAAHHGGTNAMKGDDEAVVSTVSVIRAVDGTAVRRIDVPGAVHHVAASPDGRFAAVTHPNAGSISVIDLGTFEVVATVETGPFPNYAVFSPDSSQIYVSNAGNDTVSAVGVKHWTVRWNAQVGGSPEHIVLSADGATLYVNNVDDGSVSVVGIDERREMETIFVGETLHGIGLSDDGKTLFVASLGAEKLVAHDLASGVQRSIALSPEPYHLAVIRGADKLYVSSADEPKIWVIDQASLDVLDEIAIGGKGHQMVLGTGG